MGPKNGDLCIDQSTEIRIRLNNLNNSHSLILVLSNVYIHLDPENIASDLKSVALLNITSVKSIN